MATIKKTTVNYKEITIDGYSGKYLVSCFDTERRVTLYSYTFPTMKGAKSCFNDLVDIQKEKMTHQF